MNGEIVLYRCKEVRRYVLELMTFIDPYAAGSPSEVFRALTAIDKAIDDIEKGALMVVPFRDETSKNLKIQ